MQRSHHTIDFDCVATVKPETVRDAQSDTPVILNEVKNLCSSAVPNDPHRNVEWILCRSHTKARRHKDECVAIARVHLHEASTRSGDATYATSTSETLRRAQSDNPVILNEVKNLRSPPPANQPHPNVEQISHNNAMSEYKHPSPAFVTLCLRVSPSTISTARKRNLRNVQDRDSSRRSE